MRTLVFVLGSLLASTVLFAQDAKPKLTLDEFFNSVSFSDVAMSPDGAAVVLTVPCQGASLRTPRLLRRPRA